MLNPVRYLIRYIQTFAFGQLKTYTHDISNGGVFVLLQKQPDLPLGTELDMKLLDSKQDDILFKMVIARKDKPGLGLRFLGYEKNGKFYTIDTLMKSAWTSWKAWLDADFPV